MRAAQGSPTGGPCLTERLAGVPVCGHCVGWEVGPSHAGHSTGADPGPHVPASRRFSYRPARAVGQAPRLKATYCPCPRLATQRVVCRWSEGLAVGPAHQHPAEADGMPARVMAPGDNSVPQLTACILWVWREGGTRLCSSSWDPAEVLSALQLKKSYFLKNQV